MTTFLIFADFLHCAELQFTFRTNQVLFVHHTQIFWCIISSEQRKKTGEKHKWVVSIPCNICKSSLSLLCHLVRVVKLFTCWFTTFNIRFKSCILFGGPKHSSHPPSVGVIVQLSPIYDRQHASLIWVNERSSASVPAKFVSLFKQKLNTWCHVSWHGCSSGIEKAFD